MVIQETAEDSWFDIALRHYKHSNYAQSVLAITKYIEENPETRNGKLLKAVICRALKNYNQGVYTLEEIIPQEEDTWQYKRTYYREFGETLQSMGKYDEAIVWFDKLIEVVPDQAQGYILKGECLESLEQYELAQLQYLRATQLKGNKEDAFYNLALLF